MFSIGSSSSDSGQSEHIQLDSEGNICSVPNVGIEYKSAQNELLESDNELLESENDSSGDGDISFDAFGDCESLALRKVTTSSPDRGSSFGRGKTVKTVRFSDPEACESKEGDDSVVVVGGGDGGSPERAGSSDYSDMMSVGSSNVIFKRSLDEAKQTKLQKEYGQGSRNPYSSGLGGDEIGDVVSINEDEFEKFLLGNGDISSVFERKVGIKGVINEGGNWVGKSENCENKSENCENKSENCENKSENCENKSENYHNEDKNHIENANIPHISHPESSNRKDSKKHPIKLIPKEANMNIWRKETTRPRAHTTNTTSMFKPVKSSSGRLSPSFRTSTGDVSLMVCVQEMAVLLSSFEGDYIDKFHSSSSLEDKMKVLVDMTKSVVSKKTPGSEPDNKRDKSSEEGTEQLREEVAILRTSNRTLSDDLDQSRLNLSKLRVEVENNDKIVRDIQVVLKEFNSETANSQLSGAIKEKFMENSRLSDENTKLKQKRDVDTQEFESNRQHVIDSASEIKNLKSELEDSQQLNEDLQASVDYLEKEIDLETIKWKQREIQLKEKYEINCKANKLVQDDLNSKEIELFEMVEQTHTVEETNKELKAGNIKLAEEMNVMKCKFNEITSIMEDAEEQLKKENEEVEMLRRKLEEINKQFDNERVEWRLQAEKKVADLTQQLESIEEMKLSERNRLESEIARQTVLFKEKERSFIQEKEKEIANMKEIHGREHSRLSSAISDKETDHEQSRKQYQRKISELENENDSIKEHVLQFQSSNDSMKEKIHGLEEQQVEFIHQLNQSVHVINEYKIKNSQLEERCKQGLVTSSVWFHSLKMIIENLLDQFREIIEEDTLKDFISNFKQVFGKNIQKDEQCLVNNEDIAIIDSINRWLNESAQLIVEEYKSIDDNNREFRQLVEQQQVEINRLVLKLEGAERKLIGGDSGDVRKTTNQGVLLR